MQPVKETHAILNLDIETIPKELEMCEQRPDVQIVSSQARGGVFRNSSESRVTGVPLPGTYN